MNELARNLILIGILLGLCVVYYIYRRKKRPLSDKYIRKGNDYVKEKKYLDAIGCYEKAIEKARYDKGSKSSALDNISLCYLEIKDYKNSEKYALEAMSISSTDYVARLLYGRVLYNKSQFYEAINHYESFVDNKATASIVYSMLALCYANIGKTQKANNAVNNADKHNYDGISELRKQIKQLMEKNKNLDIGNSKKNKNKDDNAKNEKIKLDFFEDSIVYKNGK